MIPRLCILAVTCVGACSAQDGYTASSMNFVEDPVDPVCARTALVGVDGLAVETAMRSDGDAVRIDSRFNGTLPMTTLLRTRADGSAEVSVFARLDREADPLDRRAADFAVEAADDAIYRQCTEDGRLYGGDDAVVIDPQENP